MKIHVNQRNLTVEQVHLRASFDGIADIYDEQFTFSITGRAQRAAVHTYLEEAFPSQPARVLELNCGTGEDAIWFANRGAHVTSTDISGEMVEKVRVKAMERELNHSIQSLCAGFADISLIPQENFDLLFSNFGGLNCIPPGEMNQLSRDILPYTRVGSRAVFVMIGPLCPWETVYFLAKGKPRKAFRRLRGKAMAHLGSHPGQMIWYPGIRKMINTFSANWKLRAVRPVGLWVPPSYLEPWVRRHSDTFSRLQGLENRWKHSSFAARLSDHYLIDLERVR